MIAKLPILAVALVSTGVCLANPAPEETELRETYFAPITSAGLWRMRMEDGAIREFEAGRSPAELVSVDGWTARIDRAKVTVKSGPRVKQARTYEFENGTLRRFRSGGVTIEPSYREPVVYEGESICPLWPELDELAPEKQHIVGTWEKDNHRLKLWFESPNQAGAFLSLVFLTFAVLALFVSRAWIRWPCAVLALATLLPIVRTDSRGTVVATGVTLAMLAVCALKRHNRLTRRTFALGVLVLALALGAGMMGLRCVSARSASNRSSSDQIRLEVWKAAPRMLCDAPWGWGPALSGAGNAYTFWYAPAGWRFRQYSLINDHLTILVSWGWLRGGAYLALWFGGLWLLWAFAFRGGSPLPAAWWTSLGICSFLNVVLLVPLLHWLPMAPLVLLAFDRRWLKGRLPAASLSVGVLGAVVVLGALACWGSAEKGKHLSLHRDGTIVEVNGSNPPVCIVDDRETLGADKTIADLRRYYSAVPQGLPVAYATDLSKALAKGGYRRLVVAGKRGGELLKRFDKGADTIRLPPEIVFVAPPFAPSELPEALCRRTRALMVIGEFHARYYPELAQPQPGVKVVKGAEMYIPGWIVYCLAGIAR